MAAEAWIRDYYKHLDVKDIDAGMEYWAPEAELRFGSAEAVFGEHAVRASLVAMVNSVASATHRPLDFWELPDGLVIFEAQVDFQRLDGGAVTVAGVAFCQVQGDQFLKQRVLVDVAPVYAPTQPTAVEVGS